MFLLSLKAALISILMIFSVGMTAFAQWEEEALTDLEVDGAGFYFESGEFGEGEGGTAEMMYRTTLGPDSIGPGGGASGTGGASGSQEMYYSTSAPTSGGSGVQQYMISGNEPTTVFYGGQSTSYSTYRSMYSGINSLWIMGSWSWTQYATCPLGSYLQLLAYSSAGGSTTFYEIYESGRVDVDSYGFWPGYSSISFYANEPGRHILLFIANNQPSNAVIIDVSSGGWPPGPGPGPSPSYARVTVRSNWLSGYSVSVDGVHSYNDVSDGSLDGVVSFYVTGNQYHNIEVSSPGFIRTYYRFFRSGYAYTLSI